MLGPVLDDHLADVRLVGDWTEAVAASRIRLRRPEAGCLIGGDVWNVTDDWHYYYILGIPFGSRLGRGRRDRNEPGRESERPSDLRDPLRDDEHFLGSRGFVAPVEEKL